MMTEQEVYLLFFRDDDGDWCKIDDVVTFCRTALCQDKCLLVDDAACPAISQDYYWSSNEETEETATLVAFMKDSIVCLDPQKTDSYRVRAAYRFQL